MIDTPLLDIIQRLRATITTGKLKDVVPKTDYIMISCPHHKGGREAHPDCGVYIGDNPSKTYGFVHCFACGWAVSFVAFVQECFESSEAFAKHWLISNYGKIITNKVCLGDHINLDKASRVNQVNDFDLSLMSTWCPYLAQRGLSRATCTKFNVKYDAAHRQVVFPCYDIEDKLVMFARRSIDTKIFYMDENVEKPVYCLNHIIKNQIKAAIITEGPFDCLTAYEYGFPAIATLGTPSLNQISHINNSCITTLYTMFDNDEAGQKFTEFLKKRISKRILIIEVKIPQGKKDINDLTKVEFLTAINNAKQNDKIVLKSAKKVV